MGIKTAISGAGDDASEFVNRYQLEALILTLHPIYSMPAINESSSKITLKD